MFGSVIARESVINLTTESMKLLTFVPLPPLIFAFRKILGPARRAVVVGWWIVVWLQPRAKYILTDSRGVIISSTFPPDTNKKVKCRQRAAALWKWRRSYRHSGTYLAGAMLSANFLHIWREGLWQKEVVNISSFPIMTTHMKNRKAWNILAALVRTDSKEMDSFTVFRKRHVSQRS